MSADLMRRYLAIVEASSHEIDSLFREPLSESVVLTEGAVADRIKAAMAKVTQRFGRPTPQVLAQVSDRADSLFSGLPAVEAVVARAKALGRSPALLAAMIGICGALIGMAPNPAAAQDAAGKLQPILSIQDVDQIIDTLAQHGVTIKSGQKNTVSMPRLDAKHSMAAHALKAIADYQYVEGARSETYREYKMVVIDGAVTKTDSEFTEVVTLWTADHQMKIAEYRTTFQYQGDMPAVVDEQSIGAQFDLWNVFQDLDEATQAAVSNWVNQNQHIDESAASNSMESLIRKKGPDFCRLVAAAATRNGRVAARVRISAKGIQVGGAA